MLLLSSCVEAQTHRSDLFNLSKKHSALLAVVRAKPVVGSVDGFLNLLFFVRPYTRIESSCHLHTEEHSKGPSSQAPESSAHFGKRRM